MHCGSPVLGLLIFLGLLPIHLHGAIVLHYDFDETFTDSSGLGNHANQIGGVTFSTGVIGQAAQFDGVNDYLQTPHSTSLNLSSEMTLAVWIKPTSIPFGNSGVIFKGTLGDGQGPYDLNIQTSGILRANLNDAAIGIGQNTSLASTPGRMLLPPSMEISSAFMSTAPKRDRLRSMERLLKRILL